jgi:tripartite-type tricarboxylate transporter receptor subunit TctC
VKRILAAAGSAALALLAATAASAQQFPSKPITLIAPFAAGGPVDVTARLYGEHMSRTLGQPVVVENVGGAGGMTGTTRVARSAPDGHTLLVHQPALAFSGALYPNLNFDPIRDFDPIALLNRTSIIVVARNSLPAKSIAELKAYGATNPISMAHAGVGSMSHLCTVMLAATLGVQGNQVAYRGGGPALNDIAAGHVDLFCSSTQTAKPLINGGSMFGLGVTSTEASKTTPPAPGLVDHPLLGKAMDFDFWQMMVAPKGTPPEVIQKLNAAVHQAIADPQFLRKFTETDVDVYPPEKMTPQFAANLLKLEMDRWTAFIKTHSISGN